MGPNDPYTRVAVEAGRHEETKQVSMIDSLQISATALLGFEGAAVALVNTKTWWNTLSAFFLFASIAILTYVLEKPVAHQTTTDTMRLANVMKVLGWLRTSNGKVTINGEQVRGYFRLIKP